MKGVTPPARCASPSVRQACEMRTFGHGGESVQGEYRASLLVACPGGSSLGRSCLPVKPEFAMRAIMLDVGHCAWLIRRQGSKLAAWPVRALQYRDFLQQPSTHNARRTASGEPVTDTGQSTPSPTSYTPNRFIRFRSVFGSTPSCFAARTMTPLLSSSTFGSNHRSTASCTSR